MYLNNMTEGPKTPCFFFTSGYIQDSPVIGSSKLKIYCNILVLKIYRSFCLQKFLSWFPSTPNMCTL